MSGIYPKSLGKKAFVRNRDIKLSGREEAHEAHVKRVMCEGVCDRCREKLQWRFRYDKYKSLKSPASCQDCHKKCITKAYRTLCTQCASKKKVCEGCCGDPNLLRKIEEPSENDSKKEELKSNEVKKIEENNENENKGNISSKEETNEIENNKDEREENSDDEENDDEEDENDEDDGDDPEKILMEEIEKQSEKIKNLQVDDWDEKKFMDFATQKYSKNRKVGAEDIKTTLS